MDGDQITQEPYLVREIVRRPRFGDLPNQEMPFEWMEKGMCWLYAERRQVFADRMLHVMDTGFSTASGTRKRRNADLNGQRP